MCVCHRVDYPAGFGIAEDITVVANDSCFMDFSRLQFFTLKAHHGIAPEFAYSSKLDPHWNRERSNAYWS